MSCFFNCHLRFTSFGCNKNNVNPMKIIEIPSACCKVMVSLKIKYARTQVPIVSPKILH